MKKLLLILLAVIAAYARCRNVGMNQFTLLKKQQDQPVICGSGFGSGTCRHHCRYYEMKDKSGLCNKCATCCRNFYNPATEILRSRLASSEATSLPLIPCQEAGGMCMDDCGGTRVHMNANCSEAHLKCCSKNNSSSSEPESKIEKPKKPSCIGGCCRFHKSPLGSKEDHYACCCHRRCCCLNSENEEEKEEVSLKCAEVEGKCRMHCRENEVNIVSYSCNLPWTKCCITEKE